MPRAGNVANVADPGQGPDAWFKALPIVTRYWFGATLVMTLAVNFQIIPVGHIYFHWDSIVQKFEVWRLLSSFLYIGGFEFNTLIALMLQVQFSERYEKGGPFNTGAGGGTADYVFMHMVMMVVTLLTYPLVTAGIGFLPPIFARNMIYGVLYAWSKRFPEGQANIWGVPIPANYLPFAYVAFTVLMGGNYFDMLHGMAVAHIYYFMAEVVPQVQGRDLLHTPQFLIDQLGIGEYQAAPEPTAQQQEQQRQRFGQVNAPASTSGGSSSGGGHNWGGGGRALGREE